MKQSANQNDQNDQNVECRMLMHADECCIVFCSRQLPDLIAENATSNTLPGSGV